MLVYDTQISSSRARGQEIVRPVIFNQKSTAKMANIENYVQSGLRAVSAVRAWQHGFFRNLVAKLAQKDNNSTDAKKSYKFNARYSKIHG